LDTDKNIQRQVGEQSKENLKANQRKDWKKKLTGSEKNSKKRSPQELHDHSGMD
jgi:hypothetical protein